MIKYFPLNNEDENVITTLRLVRDTLKDALNSKTQTADSFSKVFKAMLWFDLITHSLNVYHALRLAITSEDKDVTPITLLVKLKEHNSIEFSKTVTKVHKDLDAIGDIELNLIELHTEIYELTEAIRNNVDLSITAPPSDHEIVFRHSINTHTAIGTVVAHSEHVKRVLRRVDDWLQEQDTNLAEADDDMFMNGIKTLFNDRENQYEDFLVSISTISTYYPQFQYAYSYLLEANADDVSGVIATLPLNSEEFKSDFALAQKYSELIVRTMISISDERSEQSESEE